MCRRHVDHDASAAETEVRFLVAPGEARSFLARAAQHLSPDLFNAARPIVFVRTTYFDSDERELFRSQRRRRIRLREYAGAPGADGIPTLTGICAFEVKEQAAGLRCKARMVADRAELMRLLRRGPGRAIDPTLAQAAAQVKSGWLRPRLTTFFRRRSLGGDGLRVTLDDRLCFCRPVRMGRAGEPAEPSEIVGRGPHLILEVKSSAGQPAWLAEAVRDFLVMTRFSKFKGGMLAIERADALRGPPAAPRASMAGPHELPRAHRADPTGDRGRDGRGLLAGRPALPALR